MLCYTFGRDKLKTLNIRNYGVNNLDTVIFCFGEIDVRCHIHKHATPQVQFVNIIDDIVQKYVDAIKQNVLQFDKITTCVYNILPPVQRYNTDENKQYPYLGTDDDRKRYTLYFNQQLKIACERNNYVFIDVYNSYVDDNGFLNKKYSDGNVHIKDFTFLELHLTNGCGILTNNL